MRVLIFVASNAIACGIEPKSKMTTMWVFLLSKSQYNSQLNSKIFNNSYNKYLIVPRKRIHFIDRNL